MERRVRKGVVKGRPARVPRLRSSDFADDLRLVTKNGEHDALAAEMAGVASLLDDAGSDTTPKKEKCGGQRAASRGRDSKWTPTWER